MLRTKYALTTSFQAIPALQFARLVKIWEDATGTQSGLAVKFPDDNFTAVISYAPAQYPIVLGNETAQGHGHGPLIGIPAQTGYPVKAASTYVQIAALAGTTVIVVEEID